MKNSIRCCISCILPCGALDVIRIVHANGRVEEIAGTVTASQIMTAYPKHVLKKPSSSAADDGMVPRIVVVPPDAELQRGKIYFLIPVPSAAAASAKAKSKSKKQSRRETETKNNTGKGGHDDHQSRRSRSRSSSCARKGDAAAAAAAVASVVVSDQYLSEIMSETVSTQRERRRGRVAVWRPHLESITEAPNDA